MGKSEEEEAEGRDELVEALLRSYRSGGGGGGGDDSEWGAEAADRLQSALSGELVCLVCLESVGEREAIWNCATCFEAFHMGCVQSWAAQALAQAALAEVPEGETAAEPSWACPKCRHEYSQREKPKKYLCYCGKVVEPRPDMWTLAHSCGDVCGRSVGSCGHSCLCLCHPGPCPPCPKVVRQACFCAAAPPKALRCGLNGWSCGGLCKRTLDCGRHKCKETCHVGDCAPCADVSRRKCRCGREEAEVACQEGDWQCDVVCGKPLRPCGEHKCAQRCHSGDCGPCVAPGANSCPCGKVEYGTGGGCRAELPLCGDTCDKVLDCGLHSCIERCHRGECPPCRESRTKRCRCGAKDRAVGCAKDFLCESKCRRLRDCGRHNCNRKCCDGSCPPCTAVCGERLGCGNHKCQSACHRGKCYPCTQVRVVACRCEKTAVRVPCGSAKQTKPPRCRHNCQLKPHCDHPAATPHRCHFGDCPPCSQTCGKDHPSGCGHICEKACHSAVLTDLNKGKAGATPWETPKPNLQRVRKPCPPCEAPVQRQCLGGHETATLLCHENRAFACGRPCGRSLPCGNHHCSLECHVAEGKAAVECEECQSLCTLPRPEGCTHACPRSCHGAPCPPCPQLVKETCHCGLNPVYSPCPELCRRTPSERRAALSCGNQCPRELSCGHRCSLLCHPSEESCADPRQCKKKVNVTCGCRRRSEKRQCRERGEGLACDGECEAVAEEARKARLHQQVSTASAASTLSQDSQEPADPNQPRRRRKKKERSDQEEEGSFLQRYRLHLAAAAVALVIPLLYILFA